MRTLCDVYAIKNVESTFKVRLDILLGMDLVWTYYGHDRGLAGERRKYHNLLKVISLVKIGCRILI